MMSSAARALRALALIGEAERPVGLMEIARTLGESPASVFRGLDALAQCGLVARYQASSRYVPGPAAERLRQTVLGRFRIREAVQPYLRQLASVSGETTSLHVRIGWYEARIAAAPGASEVTNAPPLGALHPLGKTCAGRAILALLSAAERARYRAWAAKRIGREHLPRLDEELAAIRACGFATGRTEYSGHATLAFAIRAVSPPPPERGEGGDVIASVTVEGPGADRGEIALWREIVANIESLAGTQAALFANPFAHLDPDAPFLRASAGSVR